MSQNNYFSTEELFQLRALEGKTLRQVIHTQWVNKTNPSDAFEFTYAITFGFTDKTSFSFTTDEDNTSISIADFDSEKRRYELLHLFNGTIDLRDDDVTENPLWKPVNGHKLLTIQLVKEDELYRNDSMLFDFGDEKMTIGLGIEGLAAEPFEEV